MHTCFLFPLICLACFPSSATASTDRCSDGHFSAESDLQQAGGGKLRRVQISRFQIDATSTDYFALRRASSRGDSCTSPVVVVVGRLASTGCQRPAAKRHFSRRVIPQTPRGSLGSLAPLGSPGSYVYACTHAFYFPSCCHYTKSNPIDDHSNISSKKVTEAKFQTIGPLYLHAVWYLPFTKSPRKHTVTYHFSDLQEVYSGNRQIHTKCQLQYFHPPHISTSVKCHCVIIHQTTKATEYIG